MVVAVKRESQRLYIRFTFCVSHGALFRGNCGRSYTWVDQSQLIWRSKIFRVRLFRWGYKDILKHSSHQSSWKESCRFQICGGCIPFFHCRYRDCKNNIGRALSSWCPRPRQIPASAGLPPGSLADTVNVLDQPQPQRKHKLRGAIYSTSVRTQDF